MRIALINENSQAAKNAVIYSALKKVADEKGFDVRNYGMYSPDDSAQLTYVQNGILAAVMLALNSFPGVICGHIETPLDAYTFAQINAGNAVSIPYALGFGWGGDLNLQYIFEKLWSEPFGSGYPKERAVPEQRNKKILDGVKEAAFRPLPDILTDLAKKDPELVKGAFAGAHFDEYFEEDCRKPEYLDLVKKLR